MQSWLWLLCSMLADQNGFLNIPVPKVFIRSILTFKSWRSSITRFWEYIIIYDYSLLLRRGPTTNLGGIYGGRGGGRHDIFKPKRVTHQLGNSLWPDSDKSFGTRLWQSGVVSLGFLMLSSGTLPAPWAAWGPWSCWGPWGPPWAAWAPSRVSARLPSSGPRHHPWTTRVHPWPRVATDVVVVVGDGQNGDDDNNTDNQDTENNASQRHAKLVVVTLFNARRSEWIFEHPCAESFSQKHSYLQKLAE